MVVIVIVVVIMIVLGECWCGCDCHGDYCRGKRAKESMCVVQDGLSRLVMS